MSFAKVQHQPGAVRALRAAAASGRLPHALLFVGPRGVGKGLAARELAKLLWCRSPQGAEQTLDPCDACTSCRRVDRDAHPDLYWFRKEPDRNDFRLSLVTRRGGQEAASPDLTVIESATLCPMEAARTVTVLDDAETLNRESANALLKILEEPPPHAILILLASDAGRLPGTILSRCQWIRFRPLPEDFVADRLRQWAKQRGRAIPDPSAVALRAMVDEQVAYVSRFAGGSVDGAIQLAESGLWELKRELVARLPEMDEAVALEAAEAIGAWARRRAKTEARTDEPREQTAIRREAARAALAAIAAAFRDALVLVTMGKNAPPCSREHLSLQGTPLTNADQPDVIRALADWPTEDVFRAVALLADAQEHLGRYVHIELATENALVQVSRLRRARTAV